MTSWNPSVEELDAVGICVNDLCDSEFDEETMAYIAECEADQQELEGIAMYESMRSQAPNDVWAEECWEA